MDYTAYSLSTGKVLRSGYCQNVEDQVGIGEGVIPNVSISSGYVVDGVVTELPTQPSLAHHFDYSTKVWVLDISVAKEQARAGITAARNNEERNGFMAYGKLFDSDTTAIQRISVAAQAAQSIGSVFTIEWTCADNSVISLDYDQMVNLPLIMAQAANTLHIKARDLKAQIELANSIEELNLITW